MRVSYKLTKRDVLEAKEKHAGLWIRLLPIFGIVLLATALASLVHDRKQFPSFVGAIVIGLFLTFFLRLQVWLAFRQDNRLQDEFAASISDSGMDVSSPKGVSKYNWSAFVRYVETKNLFLIYQTPHVFNAFPKRGLRAGGCRHVSQPTRSKIGCGLNCLRKKNSSANVGLLDRSCHHIDSACHGRSEHPVVRARIVRLWKSGDFTSYRVVSVMAMLRQFRLDNH